MQRIPALFLLCASACAAHAQDAEDASSETANAATRELERVRVVAPRFEPDPFEFKDPIEIQGSAFDKYYRPPPTPEDISLGGGYILYGINYGLMKTAQQVTKLPGWKHQIQDATARPPPLDEAQMLRAARQMDAGDIR